MTANLNFASDKIRISGLFDARFYLLANPDVAAAKVDPLEHYVELGAAEGRHPNVGFDAAEYRRFVKDAPPDNLLSFLQFIAFSGQERSDYAGLMRDATPEMRKAAGVIATSSAFDTDYYATQLARGLRYIVPVLHYVMTGSHSGLRPNREFDPSFYRATYPDVVENGSDPLVHYIEYGRSEGRSGSSVASCSIEDIEAILASGLFDETYYRKMVTILPMSVDPLHHYLNVGSLNHVSPSADFDAIFYYATVPSSRSSGLPPLVHYLRYGKAAGNQIKPIGKYHWIEHPVTGEGSVHIERLHAASFFYRHDLGADDNMGIRHRRAAVAELAKRAPCDSRGVNPAVSIIIPVYGQLPFVLNCLDSLSIHRSKHSFEIILFDDASPKDTEIGSLVDIPWLRYVYGGENRGFIGACNHAADLANGKYVVLLNSDTRVCDGWLDELIDTFSDQPGAGFVGSKLYNGDGSLQEAGGIVWADGSAWNYGRDDRPDRPEYCYARQVDYCSGAAIAVPRELWRELGGFDTHFLPAYYEDVDLAFRVRQAGRQVWMQPLARIIHYEGKTHGRDDTRGVKASQVTNSRKFYKRWQLLLRDHGQNGTQPLNASNRAFRKHMLAIDSETPAPSRDAGSVMTVKLLQIYQRLGWHVSFMPVHDPRFHADHSPDLQRVGIEVLSNTDVNELLRSRSNMYEAVLGFRVTVLEGLVDQLRLLDPAMLVLFHDIDLHFLRMEREAKLMSSPVLARRADVMKTTELELAMKVDCTIVPSTVEKDILHEELGIDNLVVYSYTADAVMNDTGYNDRRDLVFVGGFRHVPNIDAMKFFITEIWPILKTRLPQDVKFYIIGSDVSDSLKELADDRIIFTGFLEDLSATLETCRVFVAPLRFGAGLKGKVVTSLSHGVPCVASSIAIEGMALTPDEHVVEANDAEMFVAQIMRVYEDEQLWNRLRQAGYAFVEKNYSWETGMDVAREILDVAELEWYRRQKANRDVRIIKKLIDCG